MPVEDRAEIKDLHRCRLRQGRTWTMTATTDLLAAVRAEALFTSNLATGSLATAAETTVAVRRAIRIHRGTRGCAVELAGADGEHPETAIPRMLWARHVIETVYATSNQEGMP
jgi:hypothetical protein